jgi:hypothetical protein
MSTLSPSVPQQLAPDPFTHQQLTRRRQQVLRTHTAIPRYWNRRLRTTMSWTGSLRHCRSQSSFPTWGRWTAPSGALAVRRWCRRPGSTPSLQHVLVLPVRRSPSDRSIPVPPSGRWNSHWIAAGPRRGSLSFSRGTFSHIFCSPAWATRPGQARWAVYV